MVLMCGFLHLVFVTSGGWLPCTVEWVPYFSEVLKHPCTLFSPFLPPSNHWHSLSMVTSCQNQTGLTPVLPEQFPFSCSVIMLVCWSRGQAGCSGPAQSCDIVSPWTGYLSGYTWVTQSGTHKGHTSVMTLITQRYQSALRTFVSLFTHIDILEHITT